MRIAGHSAPSPTLPNDGGVAITRACNLPRLVSPFKKKIII